MTEGKADTTAARFADNVRARRELLGKSQQDIAQGLRDLGFESFRQQTVAEVESGRRMVKLDEAYAWARILGQTVDSLIRPVGLARQANALLDSANNLLESTRQEARWSAEMESAIRRVRKAITAAKGNADQLADELAVARRALSTAGVTDD